MAYIKLKEVERWVIKFANTKRKKHGLKPFRTDRVLKSTARLHCEEMVSKNMVFHSEDAGTYYAENVAVTKLHRNPKAIALRLHVSWIKSPGHRKNIINPRFKFIGVGVKRTRNSFFATQIFDEKSEQEEHPAFAALKELFH